MGAVASGKRELSPLEMSNRIEKGFFGKAGELAAQAHAAGGSSPKNVIKITHKGKDKTSSEIEGFKDCVYCYDFILCEGLTAPAPGATGASAYSSEPCIFYVARNANVKIVSVVTSKDVVDIEIAKLYEANGKVQAEETYEFKDARFCVYPVDLGEQAKGYMFTYDSREYKCFEFDESGTKKGVADQAKTVFSKGENK